MPKLAENVIKPTITSGMKPNSSYEVKPGFVNRLPLLNQSENVESVIMNSEQESILNEV
jgi:hypothetical protein